MNTRFKKVFVLLLVVIISASCMRIPSEPTQPTTTNVPSSTATNSPVPPTLTATATLTLTPVPTTTALWANPEFKWKSVQIYDSGQSNAIVLTYTFDKCLKFEIAYTQDAQPVAFESLFCSIMYADPNDTYFFFKLSQKIKENSVYFEKLQSLPSIEPTWLKEHITYVEDIPFLITHIHGYHPEEARVYWVTYNEDYAREVHQNQFCIYCDEFNPFEHKVFKFSSSRYYNVQKFRSLPTGYFEGWPSYIAYLPLDPNPQEQLKRNILLIYEYPDGSWISLVKFEDTLVGKTIEEVYELPRRFTISAYSTGGIPFEVETNLFYK